MPNGAIGDLETLLRRVFIPVLENHSDWQEKVQPTVSNTAMQSARFSDTLVQVKNQLIEQSERFRGILGEAVETLVDGIQLAKPSAEWLAGADLTKRWCDTMVSPWNALTISLIRPLSGT